MSRNKIKRMMFLKVITVICLVINGTLAIRAMQHFKSNPRLATHLIMFYALSSIALCYSSADLKATWYKQRKAELDSLVEDEAEDDKK